MTISMNRFCLFLLLTTLILIIAGMFLVLTSLHYEKAPGQEIRLETRRDVNDMSLKSNDNEPRPVFPEDFHATGLLILPHSSIAEPFEIWFSTTLGASRIDYYYGTDKTFQRGDEGENGKYYKVVPMYNDKQGNFEGCWTLQGTKYRPIFAQTVIPNITWFKYVETEVYTGTLATKWHYEYWAYGMLNSQYVWVTKSKPHRPIRYEMKGYDSMLGSYYDHYVLEYISFEQWRPQMQTLEMRQDVHCFNWSLTLESSLIANPMQEFTPFSADRLVDVNEMYTDFKKDHGKVYDNEKEHTKRKHIYKHNMRYIRSINRKKHHYKLSSNHFTDLSDDEFEAQLGSITRSDPRNHTGMKQLHKHKPEYVGKAPAAIDIPEELDWRDYGAVSTVKGQGICGSCYTFSAAGAAEGAHFLKTGNLVELSSQQILDCSWGSGNHGCKGGHYAAALSFLYLHGAATLDSYGKYLAQEGVCHFNDTILGAKPDAFAYVPSYNNTALKRAIAKFGPAAISINVSPLSFKFYSRGIYHDPDCWSNRTRHSALVIGYGSENGKEYWIVKNSWSDTWGERGYMRVAMEGNTCGITEAPVVALVNHVTFQFPIKEKITSIDSADPVSMGRKVKALKRKKKISISSNKTKKSSKVVENGNYTVKPKGKVIKKPIAVANTIKVDHDANIVDDKLVYDKRVSNTVNKAHSTYNAKTSTSKVMKKIKNRHSAKSVTVHNTDHQFHLKTTQSTDSDDKETPKIEPHNEKHDIGALGDTVAETEADNTAKDDINGDSRLENVKGAITAMNQKEARVDNVRGDIMSEVNQIGATDKPGVDDFKLPVLAMNVDQSKLPNAFAENIKSQPSNPQASTELNTQSTETEGVNDGLDGGSSLKTDDTDITARDSDGMVDVNVKVTKKNRGKFNRKTKKNRKNRQGIKKSKTVKQNWLQDIQTIEKKSVISDLEDKQPPLKVNRLQNVLKDTMSDLYAKIDRAIVSAKRG